MDSTTKWLLRGAAVVVIAVGGTGIFTMISVINKSNSENKVTVDLDKRRTTGNLCPGSYAYIGGGYCRQVICGDAGGHDPRLGGKGWSCKGKGLFRTTLIFKGDFGTLGGGASNAVESTTDERCPLVEPEIGRNNSCQNGLTEKQIFSSSGLTRSTN